jgi:hypothetical protein
VPVATRAAIAALLLSACSCDAPVAPTPTPEVVEVAAPIVSLPSASRSDLGPVTPMVSVEVTDDAFHVSNTALVATWPAHDRDALASARPSGDAHWPEVDEEIHAHGDDLAIATLRDAFAHAVNVDHARGSLSGTTGAPIAFALRAAPDVRFVRILQAIYAAGLAGYAEPRLVLLSPTSEVMLPLPLPTTEPARERDVARDLARALAAAGIVDPAAPSDDDAPALVPLVETSVGVVLAADGLHVARDGRPLAPSCTEAAEADTLVITTAELVPSRVSRCLDAAGATGLITFQAPADTRYADAIAILETLAARGPVGLAVAR